MMINLELFRVFLTVAEVKNVTRASEKLNISQPAVTKHIKTLESLLNTPLFIRTKRGVVLTEYGKILYLKVKQGLSQIDEGVSLIKNQQDTHTGTIKIGTSTTLAKIFLVEVIERFHKAYPNITIDIDTDPTKELLTKLKNGEIDFIIGKKRNSFDKELNYKKLKTTRYMFVYNPKYFRFPQKITAKDLENYPLLIQSSPSNSKESADTYFKENNLNIEPKMNIASSNLLVDFIKIGYGIGYVTKLFIEDDLKSRTLKEVPVFPKPEKIEFGIITLKNNIQSLNCVEFIDFIKNQE